MRTTKHTCQRCGGNRHVRSDRPNDGYCGQCRQIMQRRGDDLPFTGRWVRRGLIMVPVIDESAEEEPEPPMCEDCQGPVSRKATRCRACSDAHRRAHIRLCECGRRIGETVDKCGTCIIAEREATWDSTALRVAHRRHVAGHRDAWTLEGEREYNRRAKRAQLARKRVA